MIESVAGIMNAAPRPWTARPRDEPGLGLREADEGARRGERHDAEEEHLAAAEDVAEAPAGDEQHGEGQRVGVDRPLEAGDRRAEVLLDRRQRDVHDRVVEHDHEQREAHGAERPPAAVVVVECDALRSSVQSSGGSGRRARRRAGGAACRAGRGEGLEAREARVVDAVARRSRPASVMRTRFMRRSCSSSRRSTQPRAAGARRRRGWRRAATAPSRSASSLTVSSSAPSSMCERLDLGEREVELLEERVQSPARRPRMTSRQSVEQLAASSAGRQTPACDD